MRATSGTSLTLLPGVEIASDQSCQDAKWLEIRVNYLRAGIRHR